MHSLILKRLTNTLICSISPKSYYSAEFWQSDLYYVAFYTQNILHLPKSNTMRKLLAVSIVLIMYSCGDIEVERHYLFTTSSLSLEWQYIQKFKNQETYPAFGLNFVVTDSPQTVIKDMDYVSSRISKSAYKFVRDNSYTMLASMETSGLFGNLMNCAKSAVVCLQEDNMACNCNSIEFPY